MLLPAAKSAETRFKPDPGLLGQARVRIPAPFGGAQPPTVEPYLRGRVPASVFGEAAQPVGLQSPAALPLLARAGAHSSMRGPNPGSEGRRGHPSRVPTAEQPGQPPL